VLILDFYRDPLIAQYCFLMNAALPLIAKLFAFTSLVSGASSWCAARTAPAFQNGRPVAFGRELLPRESQHALSAVKLEGRTIQGEVKPLNNFVLVKLAAAQEKTDGGILLTGKAKVVKTQGQVVAVGPGRTYPDSGIVVSVPVSSGEGVVYGKYDGTEIEYNDAKHTLIRDDDVLIKFAGGDLTLENAEVIRDNVLVRVDTSEKTTEGGILIAKTSSADKRPSTGEVIKVGPGRTASNGEIMPMEVAPGDMIKFRDFASNDVEIEGQEYCVVKMADILAKF
jgi:chaperonin GroES